MEVFYMKKKMISALILLQVSILSFINAYADVTDGLNNAKTTVITQVKNVVNNVVIPVLDVILVAALLFAIGKAIVSYRKGHDIELTWIVLIIIGIVIISTFEQWGWLLIPN
jgi:hypothetical protein